LEKGEISSFLSEGVSFRAKGSTEERGDGLKITNYKNYFN